VWEKLKAALEAGFAAEPDESKRDGVSKAVELGLRKVRAEQAGEEVPEELATAWAAADRAVFSAIRAKRHLRGVGDVRAVVRGHGCPT
jgi:hypothetical protein